MELGELVNARDVRAYSSRQLTFQGRIVLNPPVESKRGLINQARRKRLDPGCHKIRWRVLIPCGSNQWVADIDTGKSPGTLLRS